MARFTLTLIKKGEPYVRDLEVNESETFDSLLDLSDFLYRDYYSVYNSVWRIERSQNRRGGIKDYFNSKYMLCVSGDVQFGERPQHKVVIDVIDKNGAIIFSSNKFINVSKFVDIENETIKYHLIRCLKCNGEKTFVSPIYGDIIIKVKEQ